MNGGQKPPHRTESFALEAPAKPPLGPTRATLSALCEPIVVPSSRGPKSLSLVALHVPTRGGIDLLDGLQISPCRHFFSLKSNDISRLPRIRPDQDTPVTAGGSHRALRPVTFILISTCCCCCCFILHSPLHSRGASASRINPRPMTPPSRQMMRDDVVLPRMEARGRAPGRTRRSSQGPPRSIIEQGFLISVTTSPLAASRWTSVPHLGPTGLIGESSLVYMIR